MSTTANKSSGEVNSNSNSFQWIARNNQFYQFSTAKLNEELKLLRANVPESVAERLIAAAKQGDRDSRDLLYILYCMNDTNLVTWVTMNPDETKTLETTGLFEVEEHKKTFRGRSSISLRRGDAPQDFAVLLSIKVRELAPRELIDEISKEREGKQKYEY